MGDLLLMMERQGASTIVVNLMRGSSDVSNKLDKLLAAIESVDCGIGRLPC